MSCWAWTSWLMSMDRWDYAFWWLDSKRLLTHSIGIVVRSFCEFVMFEIVGGMLGSLPWQPWQLCAAKVLPQDVQELPNWMFLILWQHQSIRKGTSWKFWSLLLKVMVETWRQTEIHSNFYEHVWKSSTIAPPKEDNSQNTAKETSQAHELWSPEAARNISCWLFICLVTVLVTTIKGNLQPDFYTWQHMKYA